MGAAGGVLTDSFILVPFCSIILASQLLLSNLSTRRTVTGELPDNLCIKPLKHTHTHVSVWSTNVWKMASLSNVQISRLSSSRLKEDRETLWQNEGTMFLEYRSPSLIHQPWFSLFKENIDTTPTTKQLECSKCLSQGLNQQWEVLDG